jgi:DNA-directed RNA polymerase specialized sigma24 family protein
MSPGRMSGSLEPSHRFDWQAIRADVLRRLRQHLRGWGTDRIEDAAQDAMLRLELFARRSGPPRNLPGLLSVICRRVAVDAIRVRTIERRQGPLSDAAGLPDDDAAALDRALLAEEVRWAAFAVMAYFRERKASCHEVAVARFFEDLDFRSLAERTGLSSDALRQRWVRCVGQLLEAVARGELSLDPPPRGKR